MRTTGDDSNRLDLNTVKRAVYSWSIRFKSAGYANEQLALLSSEYLEDLQGENVTLRQFESAAKLVRKRCKFFPTMAEILDCVNECRRRPELMLPANGFGPVAQIEASTTDGDNWTDEEIARNRERIGHILAMLSNEKTMDQAVSDVERCGTVKEFGGK